LLRGKETKFLNRNLASIREFNLQSGEQLLSKWPNLNEEMALGNLLTGNKDKELKILYALTNNIKCNWENHLKKT